MPVIDLFTASAFVNLCTITEALANRIELLGEGEAVFEIEDLPAYAEWLTHCNDFNLPE